MNDAPERNMGTNPAGDAGIRVSAREREEIAAHLQGAFAQGMLDEREFDERVKSALSAKTRGELYPLVADLPQLRTDTSAHGARPAGRFITTYGSRVERKGRWIVPGRVRPVVFKGKAVIDLRAATLTEEETRFGVTAYKSTIEIIVPPGVGVDARGFAYKGGWIDETGDEERPGGAPAGRTIRLRGIAYKSTVTIRRTPKSGGRIT